MKKWKVFWGVSGAYQKRVLVKPYAIVVDSHAIMVDPLTIVVNPQAIVVDPHVIVVDPHTITVDPHAIMDHGTHKFMTVRVSTNKGSMTYGEEISA